MNKLNILFLCLLAASSVSCRSFHETATSEEIHKQLNTNLSLGDIPIYNFFDNEKHVYLTDIFTFLNRELNFNSDRKIYVLVESGLCGRKVMTDSAITGVPLVNVKIIDFINIFCERYDLSYKVYGNNLLFYAEELNYCQPN